MPVLIQQIAELNTLVFKFNCFSFICLYYLNTVYDFVEIFFFLQFPNEFPSRIAPLLRMPTFVDMSPQERQAADLYIGEVRDLFAE